MIDLYASLPHYAEHCWPVWEQLDRLGLCGASYAARSTAWWRSAALPRPSPQRGVQPVLVASYADYQRTAPAPVVYLEHGAGQTYDGDEHSKAHPSYSSGKHLERVVLFLCPNEVVATRRRAAYPNVPVEVVGCPKLDAWHARDSRRPPTKSSTVAITFHWECPLVPETLSALRHYERHLRGVVRWAEGAGVDLIGHGHPRWWRHLRALWWGMGVEPVEHFGDVLERADVLAADNTSALFEFASVGRPVVVLNAPWYRRDVEHGGRFWRWADVGVQVDEPGELPAALELALADPTDVRQNRERVVAEVYPMRDGHAAERAAKVVAAVLPRLDLRDGAGARATRTAIVRGF